MQKSINTGYFLYHSKGKSELNKLLKNMQVNKSDFIELNGRDLDLIPEGETVKIPYRLSGCIVGRFYSLSRNDNLRAVAKRQGLKVSQLLDSNPSFNPGKVYLGQIIVLPQMNNPEKETAEYTVEGRETLADILRKFDLSIRDLQEENTGLNVFSLKPGQTLHIRKKDEGKKRAYILQEDETIFTVAQKFNLMVIDILKTNPNLRPLEIKQGIKIILPE